MKAETESAAGTSVWGQARFELTKLDEPYQSVSNRYTAGGIKTPRDSQRRKKASNFLEVVPELAGRWFGMSVHLWPKTHLRQTSSKYPAYKL
jgi:hypothetical protein